MGKSLFTAAMIVALATPALVMAAAKRISRSQRF